MILKILDLSSNRIRVLPLRLLHPLPAIETLLLENNKIKVLPDDWFSQKEEVPYLYLSANPWTCSCSLGYLRRYLDSYEFNVYVRDGPIIEVNADSVVCDSPQTLKGKPVLTLEESELCSPPGSGPVVTATVTSQVTTASTTVSMNEVAGDRRQSETAAAAAGAFCFWLFAGGLLLCVVAAACVLVTLARLVVWYRRVYKPLSAALVKRGRGGGEGVGLLTYSGREEQEVAGGGVMALYRSVLFVSREEGEAKETEGAGREVVTLQPTGGGGARGGEEKEGGREERGVYRKMMYRLVTKQEELEGWRDVIEECRVNAEDGGRRGGGVDGGGVSRKRYSVILREEKEEAGGGREELDWVVGGWEVKRGGAEEPRSSWGEWLAHYLPSMPWGVSTPPEGEAAE
ncbi:hypothetical protein PAMA_013564 [Pampus argenteus]